MTLKEIAKEAGVAVSTVSRVINQPGTKAAGPEVQARIWEIVRRTGYTPNPIARSLQGKEWLPAGHRAIYGLIACAPGEVKDDPFYPIIVSSMEQEMARHGMVLQYTYSIMELDNPNVFEQVREGGHNSLIVVGRFPPALLETLRKKFENIVYVGMNALEVDCDQVVCDGYAVAQDVVRYFYDRGHRSIGFIGAEVEGRHRGYLEGMRCCGLPQDPRLVVQTDALSMDEGFFGMNQLLDQARQVTAVLCANDMTAIGALQACRERGVRVPEDISLMGIVDIPNTRYVQPKLSTVHAPLDDMGKIAVRTLLDRIENDRELPVKVLLPYQIIERESCAALTKQAAESKEE